MTERMSGDPESLYAGVHAYLSEVPLEISQEFLRIFVILLSVLGHGRSW